MLSQILRVQGYKHLVGIMISYNFLVSIFDDFSNYLTVNYCDYLM
jgi:hypothetical protein